MVVAAALVIATGWIGFVGYRWLTPGGPVSTEIGLTVVALGCVLVAGMALADRVRTASVTALAIALTVSGLVVLLGLNTDSISSRLWMWSGWVALATGSAALALLSLPRPGRALWIAVGVWVLLTVGAVNQVVNCSPELTPSWCDPRFDQEERIIDQLGGAIVRRGHAGGDLGPAFAVFEYEQPPDAAIAVVPAGARVTRATATEAEFGFVGGDAGCRARSELRETTLTFFVTCRASPD